MIAISSSPRKTTSRVWLRIAGMSEATKNSPSPRPTTIGGPLRTVTILFGSSADDQHQRKQAAHVEQRAPHGVLEPVVLHLALDQVRDDLGVGLGDELVPFLLQLALQLEIVLDDAVVHDDDPSGAVAVRVRVLLGRTAVRRPAGVADAVFAFERLRARSPLRGGASLPALRRSSIWPVTHAPRRPPSRSRGTRAGAARR